MQNKNIKVQNIVNFFDLQILNMEAADLQKEINDPAIQRLGLELSGFFALRKSAKNIIGWGSKEFKWLKSLKQNNAKKAINQVVSQNTPLVILSMGMDDPIIDWIVEECSKYHIAVAKSEHRLFSINSTIGWYLVNHFAKSTSVHASLVIINGVGVMIVGKSGIGKSEAVLELVQKGHSFVSDDTVVIKRVGKQFIGSSSPLTKDLLEARGIGLVNMTHIYGQKSTKNSTRIELVVELVSRELFHKVDRLGNKNLKYKARGLSINKIQIPVHHGRSVAALVEAATNVYLARKRGIDSLATIRERSK